MTMEARLTYPATIAADGITVTHRTPALALCRALVEAGRPDGPLTVVDDRTGSRLLLVPGIHAAAGLTVEESASAGPKFSKYRPFDRENIDARGVGVRSGSREDRPLGNDEGEDE